MAFPRLAWFLFVVSAAVVSAVAILWTVSMLQERRAANERVAQGRVLYQEHCASCHGVNLEGQPDWQTQLPSGRLPAPPHDATGHTWHHSDRLLFEITKYGTEAVVSGDYESDMPGFADVLSDDEIRVVLEFIKSTWPEEERRYQEEMSRREPLDAQ